jgi:hypothetical protein
MKGFSVQDGNELRIEIEGERWSQGDRIRVRLQSKREAHLFLGLASGFEKRIKTKSEEAFEIHEQIELKHSMIEKEFLLPNDARITDKAGSLYALYGIGNPPATLSSLRLQIEPHPHIRDLAEVLTHHFRFTLKSTSMGKKQEVELKFEPSGSKEWASLETLTISARLLKTELELKFLFQRKEINALNTAFTAQSVKKTIEKNFALNELIHDFNQRLNKESVTAGLDLVFEEYRSQGGIFS